MTLSLRNKAIIVVSVTLLFVLGINAFFLIRTASERYTQTILRKTESIGKGIEAKINEMSGSGVPLPSITFVNSELEQLAKLDDTIAYALVADHDGVAMFHSEASKRGSKIPDEDVLRAVKARAAGVVPGHSLHLMHFPLLDAGAVPIASLVISIKTDLIRDMLATVAGISCIGLLLSILLVNLFITRDITSPVLRIEKAANLIADGDLRQVIDTKGDDEIARLGSAINRTAGNLNAMLLHVAAAVSSVSRATMSLSGLSHKMAADAGVQRAQVDETSASTRTIDTSIRELDALASKLFDMAQGTTGTVESMAASMNKLNDTAGVLETFATDTVASVGQMTVAIREINENVSVLVDTDERILDVMRDANVRVRDIRKHAGESVRLAEHVSSDMAERGIAAADDACGKMREISDSMEHLSDAINVLSAHSNDIGSIVTLIDDIAAKVKMLSLNTAILSAQAGEHGKPFQVVSDEIKKLAGQTSDSTRTIGVLVRTVRETIDRSIATAAAGRQKVIEGIAVTSHVADALHEVRNSAVLSTTMARAIEDATTDQSEAIEKITRSMERARESFKGIRTAVHEQSQGSMVMLAGNEKIRELAEGMKGIVERQNAGIRQMLDAMREVTRMTQLVASTTSLHHERTGAIDSSMSRMLDMARDMEAASQEIIRITTTLGSEAETLRLEVGRFSGTASVAPESTADAPHQIKTAEAHPVATRHHHGGLRRIVRGILRSA